MNVNNKIKWISKNKHIIISSRNSFYPNDNNEIFVVYREKRDYSKFNSYYYYGIEWLMQRWEDTLEKAIEFALSVPDEVLTI